MNSQIVFDLDLDFFVRPTFEVTSDNDPRQSDTEATVDTFDQVKDFLSASLGLETTKPIPGAVVRNHVEVFEYWNTLIEAGRLRPKFSVVHIDAHGDVFGHEWNKKLHSGNFLIHAVRRAWLDHICFVYPDEKVDLPYVYLTPDYHLKFGGENVSISIHHRCDPDLIFEINQKQPEFFFLATSPASTPPKADALIPVISKYISPL